MNRALLQLLTKDRIADARALLTAKRWSGAYYLAGYAVECALKACIAKFVQAEDFPDKALAEKAYTHDLERLVLVAGLKAAHDAERAAVREFAANWTIVKDWNESSRYTRRSKAHAIGLYQAITSKRHGVLPWIRSRW